VRVGAQAVQPILHEEGLFQDVLQHCIICVVGDSGLGGGDVGLVVDWWLALVDWELTLAGMVGGDSEKPACCCAAADVAAGLPPPAGWF
jgi:hypothetical protein